MEELWRGFGRTFFQQIKRKKTLLPRFSRIILYFCRNPVNKDHYATFQPAFIMKQEHELKSLLTEQQFEVSNERDLLLAQARACANGYALATEGIAVVSDFQNNECHIYSGKFGQSIMNLPEYMVDHSSAFENIIFSRANEDELIERHVLELRFFNFPFIPAYFRPTSMRE